MAIKVEEGGDASGWCPSRRGRKARDRPTEPLLTYSLTLRATDVGYLNQFGRGNLSLGLRRLIDQARIHLAARPSERLDLIVPPNASLLPGASPSADAAAVVGHKNGATQYE
jgi:hypothetical protein